MTATRALVLETARTSFELLLSVGAGTGLLYLLRWFWWRINAWSEIAAMASSFLLATALFIAQRRGVVIPSHISLIGMVAVTTLVWLVTAYVTRPTDPDTLRSFYRLAQPAGPGWRRIRAECPGATTPDDLSLSFLGWAAGIALVYGVLLGTGQLLLGHTVLGSVGLAIGAAGALILIRILPRLWADRPVTTERG